MRIFSFYLLRLLVRTYHISTLFSLIKFNLDFRTKILKLYTDFCLFDIFIANSWGGGQNCTGTLLHGDTFAQRDTFARWDTFAR